MTFGLVHGGAHGAWCWEHVVATLKGRGHRGVAVDLPCEDPEAGTAEYARVVAESLAGDDDVVLVGHSLGGLTVPLVATLRPARVMIFVAGLLPVPGRSLRDQQAEEPDMMFPYHGGRAGLRERFFGTSPAVEADRAMARIRTQALKPFVEPSPLTGWPAVPARYVVCTEDRACNPDWGRRAARERLGTPAVELEGSDHSPFLGRAEELTDLLIELA